MVLVANTVITSPCVPFSSQMKTFSALLVLSVGNSQFTGQFPTQRPVCGALMFSLISAWIKGCVNTCKADDYHDVTVMCLLWYDITNGMTMASARYKSNYVLTNDTPQWHHPIFRVTGPLYRDFTGHRWIPPQRPVKRSFDIFFDLRLIKRLSNQSRRRWFETPVRSLLRHCNALALSHGLAM